MSVVITLTTDFGTRDSYVAEMKAVILRLNPAVQLVDVTHDIAPHDVVEGALAVEAVAAVCPPGTVHVAVVDPGVGTGRRGLAVTAAGQTFIGPDNGVFTPILALPGWSAFELSAAEYRRPAVSATFHGRDVFGPAAAHVALGISPSRLGDPVRDPVRLPSVAARLVAAGVEGEVIRVDRFGNLVTSIDVGAVEEVVARFRGTLTIRIAGRRVPLVRTYGDLVVGGLGALVGSGGRLEVVVREGSAAARLKAGRGTAVSVRGSSGERGRPSKQRRGRRPLSGISCSTRSSRAPGPRRS